MKVSDKDLGLVLRAAEAHFAAHGSLTSAVVEAIEALPDARPGPMPSRHQLAAELAALGEGSAWHGWAKLGGDLQNAYLKEADHAIARCAAGKLPAEAWRLVEAWHEAAACDDDACIAYDLAANKLEAALKSAPKPNMDIDYREQHKRERAEWTDCAQRMATQIRNLEKKCKRLEDERGRANCERDEARAEIERWRQRHADVEEQLRSAVAQGVVESEARAEPAPGAAVRALCVLWGSCSQGNELRAALEQDGLSAPTHEAELEHLRGEYKVAFATASKRIAELESDLKATEFGRQSAIAGIADLEAKLATVTQERNVARTEMEMTEQVLRNIEHAHCIEGDYAPDYESDTRHPIERRLASMQAMHTADVEKLREQLAARPEPVVIDWALARRLRDKIVFSDDTVRGVDEIAAVLRSMFGDRVSVAAPPVYDEAAADLMVREERDQLRAELTKLRSWESECKAHRESLFRIADALRMSVERDANGDIQMPCGSDIAAETEKLRADLAACRVERDTWLAEHGRLGRETPRLAPIYELVDAVVERVGRLERFVNDVHAACEYPAACAIQQIRSAAEALDARSKT